MLAFLGPIGEGEILMFQTTAYGALFLEIRPPGGIHVFDRNGPKLEHVFKTITHMRFRQGAKFREKSAP